MIALFGFIGFGASILALIALIEPTLVHIPFLGKSGRIKDFLLYAFIGCICAGLFVKKEKERTTIVVNPVNEDSSRKRSHLNEQKTEQDIVTESSALERLLDGEEIEELDKPNWNYRESQDEMSGDTRYFASSYSTNRINFDAPYAGGSSFDLIIRNMDGKTSVLMTVSKGQFILGYGESKKARIKLDEEAPFTMTYSSSNDGSADVIFFDYPSKLIGEIKKAKKLMIEASFYSAGRKVVYFDVEGLEWEY